MAIGLVILVGGTNAVAVRFSNFELPPFWGAALLFGLATAIFRAIVALRRLPRPTGRSLLGAMLCGSVGIGHMYAFLYRSLAEV